MKYLELKYTVKAKVCPLCIVLVCSPGHGWLGAGSLPDGVFVISSCQRRVKILVNHGQLALYLQIDQYQL